MQENIKNDCTPTSITNHNIPYPPPSTHSYTIWISEEDHIASFHNVHGCVEQTFTSQECLMEYLFLLQKCGFRFG